MQDLRKKRLLGILKDMKKRFCIVASLIITINIYYVFEEPLDIKIKWAILTAIVLAILAGFMWCTDHLVHQKRVCPTFYTKLVSAFRPE